MTRSEVIAYIQDIKFGYLATVDAGNAPRVRPVGMYTVYGDALYFFTMANTRKTTEIDNNPHVEVVWSKLEEQSQVRISGQMIVEEDEAIIQQFKADNPIVANLLPDAVQHLFRLYKLVPDKVYWAKGMVPYTEIAW
jgi:uncharacterized pyridoxamine 5'-phosphate oxidase family protein